MKRFIATFIETVRHFMSIERRNNVYLSIGLRNLHYYAWKILIRLFGI